MDRVLVTQPITALHCVIGMPSPVVAMHVPQCCVDASLCCYCMRAGGEQLGHTGGFEALLDQSEGSSQACSSCTHNHCIEGMINYCVLLEQCILNEDRCTSPSFDKDSFPTIEKEYAGTGLSNLLILLLSFNIFQYLIILPILIIRNIVRNRKLALRHFFSSAINPTIVESYPMPDVERH